jgi:hypothetical protein
MRSSFEDLVVTSPSVKTDFQSDKQFALKNILNIRIFHLMQMTSPVWVYSACMQNTRELGRRGGNPARGCDDLGEVGKQLRWGCEHN